MEATSSGSPLRVEVRVAILAGLSTRRRSHLAGVAGSVFLFSLSALHGCVSAVDDTTAFGFAEGASLTQVAASQSAPNEPGEATRETDADAGAATLVADAASADAAKKPSSESAGTPVAEAGSHSRAIEQPAVAAYAGATVAQGDAAEDSSAAQGNKSLFASLFARSSARTPIANAEKGKGRRVVLKREGAPESTDQSDLPGVDPKSLFEIGQRASADEDMLEDVEGSYQVASLSGLARLAPNGLLVQRQDVDTSCFPRDLVGILRTIERRFGEQVVVTSGYRSPSHNRRVHGAKRSQHMGCKAADIIVPNVDHLTVARFVRALPGRGGVGTYCHTQAIHVDVGPQRDWNWRCRRRD